MIGHYVALAARRSVRHPLIVVLAVVTLAIGIAACMTALAIFHALEGEPLPGVSDHLHVITMDAREVVATGGKGTTAPGARSLLKLRDAVALVDARRARSQVALAETTPRVSRADGTRSDVTFGYLAYGPVLQELGVPMLSGRGWNADEQASRAPVVVIGTELARRLFGTQDAVGRSVRINQRLFHVIGVTAPWKPRVPFVDASAGVTEGFPVQLFLPVGAALDAGIGPSTSGVCEGGVPAVTFGSVDIQHCRWLEVWVALSTPSALVGYDDFLTRYARAQHDAGRFANPPHARLYGTQAWLALKHVVPGDVQLNLILAGAFLALCVINVTGLLTARFVGRQADIAIRRALGASWQQVFTQYLVESGLLGLAGGLLALPLTWFGMWIVRQQPAVYAPAAQPSWGVLWALIVTSLIVGMLIGVLPAWRACRLPPATEIKQAV